MRVIERTLRRVPNVYYRRAAYALICGSAAYGLALGDLRIISPNEIYSIVLFTLIGWSFGDE